MSPVALFEAFIWIWILIAGGTFVYLLIAIVVFEVTDLGRSRENRRIVVITIPALSG